MNPKFTARLVVEPSKPANEHGHPTPRRLAPEPAQSLSSTPSHGQPPGGRGFRCVHGRQRFFPAAAMRAFVMLPSAAAIPASPR